MPFVISGDLKRICETEFSLRYLSVVSQNMCSRLMGGRKTDAVSGRVPLVSDIPTIIFGADVTHPENGEVVFMGFTDFTDLVRKIHIFRSNISLIFPRTTNVGCSTQNCNQSRPRMSWTLCRGKQISRFLRE
ncbi:hypothetical protein YC2023_115705 [Brassica napus]